MNYFIYAETAFHHEGDINYLLDLVNLTKECNYEGIKFQVIGELSSYMVRRHSQYKMIEKMILSMDEWKKVIVYAKSLNLKVIFMPLDSVSINWAIKHSDLIDYIDIHSVSFYDQPLLAKIKELQKPIILGVGGRTLDEIESAFSYFGEQISVLMHGFQSFPTELTNARLLRIPALKKLYPNVLVGYADHSPFESEDSVKALEYAYFLGARVFEKHITMNEGKKRTDYSSAVGKDKMLKIKMNLNRLENIHKDLDVFNLLPDEIKYRERQKKLVALKNIEIGEKISEDNTILKVIDEEENCGYFNQYLSGNYYAKDKIIQDSPILRESVYEKNGD